jgi:hypothetical protein
MVIMITNRRNFLIGSVLADMGLATFPSFALSEEKGFAMQNPLDKQKMRGFLYIPTVWGEQLRVPDFMGRVTIGFVEAIKKYSGIDAKVDPPVYLSSPHLNEYPILYIATDKAFELTKTERNNFENYLRNGGFAVLESLEERELELSQAEASLKQMAKDAVKEEARFLPIPVSHQLYHCFFDFNDGPPKGTENNDYISTNTTIINSTIPRSITLPKPRPYLEGIFLDDRLAVVYSGKGYGNKWKEILNNDPQQKIAVNFVVYALTQGNCKKSSVNAQEKSR